MARSIAALGVPLDCQDEVARGVGFYGFDDGVLGAAGGDAEALAGDSDGLVVAGVDGEAEEAILLRGLEGWGNGLGEEDGAEERVWGDCSSRVSDRYGCSLRRDLRACTVKVLEESAAAPDIEELDAEADGEDGLVAG